MTHEYLIGIEYIDEFIAVLEENQSAHKEGEPLYIIIQMQIDTISALQDYINIRSKERTAYILNEVTKEIDV